MALGNFWDRIRVLYRQLAPRTVRQPSKPSTAPRAPVPAPPAAPQVPIPQAGPMDLATKMDVISKAGSSLRLLFIKYDGMSREVEPYSFRQKSTGMLFFGFCSVHNRIHSFRIEKIEEIQMLNKSFAPRWPVEV